MMKNIPLNDFALDILKEAEWFVQNENYKSVRLQGEDQIKNRDRWTSHKYFHEIKNKGKMHNGFPECICSYSFGQGQLKFDQNAGEAVNEVAFHQEKFLREIQSIFNLKRNALFSVYPPGGFISWHNNANASAYNFIFTYSETGDGYWEHYDTKTKEIVRISDVQGWQCKAGYFGAYEDGEDRLVYHAAQNGFSGLRMTIAFVLDRSELSSGLQEWVIEDIHK
jgi:hypothetical protein